MEAPKKEEFSQKSNSPKFALVVISRSFDYLNGFFREVSIHFL